MKIKSLLFTVAMTMLFSTTAMATEGMTNVEYHTAEEIVAYYRYLDIDITHYFEMEVAPDTVNKTTSGELTEETAQRALDIVNFARYIAGIDHDVELDDEYMQMSQDGAFINDLNNDLEHYPIQPDGVSDEMYDSGYAGNRHGNISSGHKTLGSNIIYGWLSDKTDSNIGTLGHRRWVLNPSMGETGFGYSKTDGVGYSAMYATDYSNDVEETIGVAWPAQTMPVEYFEDDFPWSYTSGSVILGNVSVTLTRQGDGATWSFDVGAWGGDGDDGFSVYNNDTYGQDGCVIFRPNNIEYKAGDVYNVSIVGYDWSANYDVEFFDLAGAVKTYPQVDYIPETDAQTEVTPVPTDVSGASSWAQAELSEAANNGDPVAVFPYKFQQNMTRGDFAYMLGMFMETDINYTLDYPCEEYFTDLGTDPDDAIGRNQYINALRQHTIINGKTATTFAPDDLITRQEIAMLIYNYATIMGNGSEPETANDISRYADASDVSDWALDAVKYANELGVLNGNDKNQLMPLANITVEEAALICYRYFETR